MDKRFVTDSTSAYMKPISTQLLHPTPLNIHESTSCKPSYKIQDHFERFTISVNRNGMRRRRVNMTRFVIELQLAANAARMKVEATDQEHRIIQGYC